MAPEKKDRSSYLYMPAAKDTILVAPTNILEEVSNELPVFLQKSLSPIKFLMSL